MWSKTFAAFIGGCLLSISLMLNLNYLLTIDVDQKLMLGLALAFPVWVIAMMMSYSARTAWQAWKRCGTPLIISAFINIFYFVG